MMLRITFRTEGLPHFTVLYRSDSAKAAPTQFSVPFSKAVLVALGRIF